jgi:hypothetical protein
MQQKFLSYRHYLWAKISLVIAVALVGSYIVYSQQTTPNGRTIAGFLYGVLGLLALLLLMYYGVRKRTYRKKQWSLQGWLSFHCYVGVLTLLIVPMHAGFSLHYNIHTLAFVLLAIVVVSGMVGAGLYYLIPRQFSQFGAELAYVGTSTIDTEINQLLQHMHALSQDKSNAFARKGLEEMQRGLPTRPVGWRLLFHRTPLATSLATHIQEFDADLQNIPAAEREAFKRLGVLATQKWELERRLVSQMRLQNLLEAWLYVHLPISIALMVAVLLHIIVVFYYGYRVL